MVFEDDNGSYLRTRLINDKPYVEFSSDNPKEIDSQRELPEDFGDTLFTPIMIRANMVALLNVGNGKFCYRDTTYSCLWAKCQSICKEAILEVIDSTLSREIYDFDYHLLHARIYGGRVLVFRTLTTTNSSSVEITESLKFSYTNTTRTWSTNVSSKLGVKTTFKAGIPYLLGEKIMVSAGINAIFKRGKTTQVSEQVKHVHQVTVPPKTRVIDRLTAAQGGCDVPFLYTQRGTLSDGSVIIHNMNDGLFNGTNIYDIKVETKEEPLN
ncbi:hypothetical protein Cgig2_025673 [Carnegiea gigantea]|uniref:Agglutinin domain-containing protein n=1 Tax=Carnegiea gigantea TaxID=171969 RepID=A0A9Q1JIY3_9CARY|nr:hypothetical protein Cgig2_025673 [Carnegiea gigantea]